MKRHLKIRFSRKKTGVYCSDYNFPLAQPNFSQLRYNQVGRHWGTKSFLIIFIFGDVISMRVALTFIQNLMVLGLYSSLHVSTSKLLHICYISTKNRFHFQPYSVELSRTNAWVRQKKSQMCLRNMIFLSIFLWICQRGKKQLKNGTFYLGLLEQI